MSYYNKQKPSKAEQPTKSPITIIWPHKEPYKTIDRTVERVIIIDPGTRNFCIRCEDRNDRGKMKPNLFAKWDILVSDASGEDVYIVTSELTRKLNSYKSMLECANLVLIERQLPINYQSTLIMQHVVTYFEILLADKKDLPIICLVDPQLKSKILAKRRMTKTELKIWSPGEAIKWLMRQDDNWSVEIIEESKKKDDYADVIVMREAYYIYLNSKFKTVIKKDDIESSSDTEIIKIQKKKITKTTRTNIKGKGKEKTINKD